MKRQTMSHSFSFSSSAVSTFSHRTQRDPYVMASFPCTIMKCAVCVCVCCSSIYCYSLFLSVTDGCWLCHCFFVRSVTYRSIDQCWATNIIIKFKTQNTSISHTMCLMMLKYGRCIVQMVQYMYVCVRCAWLGNGCHGWVLGCDM